MNRITVTASKNYNIIVGQNLLREAGDYVASVMTPCKLCIVTDSTVDALYGQTVSNALESARFSVCKFTFSPGEDSKTLRTFSHLLEFLAKNELTRSDAIIALGGGITGDLAGFAAACYLRGIPFVQIPTTLLAAVDASVGGKTGVNLPQGKNLAGAFWQPSLVLCDCNVLATLPDPMLLDGIAEAIKCGMIVDSTLFDFLASRDLPSLCGADSGEDLVHVILRCVTIKGNIVGEDERDTGKRQLLNFGHTIAHAIEKCSDYQVSHGHAVALGMLVVSRAAYRMGLVSKDSSLALADILTRYGFPLAVPFSAMDLSIAALMDKKRTSDQITLVIPHDIGDCQLEKIDVGILERFIGEGL